MKKFISSIMASIILTVGLMSGAAFADEVGATEEEIPVIYAIPIPTNVEEMKHNVVMIQVTSTPKNDPSMEYSHWGTGFFIEGGYIATSSHVVNRDFDDHTTKSIKYKKYGETKYKDIISVAIDSPKDDLAVLETNEVDHSYFELRNTNVGDKKEFITIIGHPSSKLKNGTDDSNTFGGSDAPIPWDVTVGKSKGEEYIHWWNKGKPVGISFQLMRMDLTVFPGYSGSPVIDSDGVVVGVVYGYSLDDPGISYAAQVRRLSKLIKDHDLYRSKTINGTVVVLDQAS